MKTEKRIDEIELAISNNELTASQVFTQMRQLILKPERKEASKGSRSQLPWLNRWNSGS